MQVKIVIGTIAFMLTMIVFGYAALREPARMVTWTAAAEARSIEQGAKLFHANCATCHGENGKAEECYDPSTGEQIGCKGLVLNHRPLLCVYEGSSERMDLMKWEGTLHGYIASTLEAGRVANGMPTWGADYGGPLEKYQIDYLTEYVMNWRTEDMCEGPVATREPLPETASGLPEGDAANGEGLFTITYGCAACHGNIDEAGSNAVGPWVGTWQAEAGNKIEGYTAADYVYESILLPSAYIAQNCPTGPCNGPPSGMPDNFGARMSNQDLADVMAYVLGTSTLEGDNVVEYP